MFRLVRLGGRTYRMSPAAEEIAASAAMFPKSSGHAVAAFAAKLGCSTATAKHLIRRLHLAGELCYPGTLASLPPGPEYVAHLTRLGYRAA